jgi:hypothetical protein
LQKTRPWIWSLIVTIAACDGRTGDELTATNTLAGTPPAGQGTGSPLEATGDGAPVVWEFPGLIQTPMGMTFPTYLAHLFGKHAEHPLSMDAVCVTVQNRGSGVLRARLEVSFPVYGAPSQQDLAVNPGQMNRFCLNPTFDFSALYALRETTSGRMEASLVDLYTGRELGAAMRDFSIVAHNEVAWAAAGATVTDMDDLSAVFVTPKAPAVDELQRQAQDHSQWKSFGGGDAYRRGGVVNRYTLAAGEYHSETVVLEPDEAVSWRLISTAGNGGVDVYLFSQEQFQSWIGDAGSGAVASWTGKQTGDAGETHVAAGSYVLVLFNPAYGSEPRAISFTRNNTREDVARDVLRSVYLSLQDLQTRYSNIPSTYFYGWQHIRLGGEVLAASSANCIDGSLLFASVLELIGMDPVILFTADHAYVGVHSSPGSRVIWPVETTLMDAASFEDAYRIAIGELTEDSANNPHFHPVDIRALRAHRILPLPQ